MKIVHIGYHCCVRLAKQALALKSKGHEVHIIGWKSPIQVEQFDFFTKCHTVAQYRNAVRAHLDANVFHIHNEPNWLVNTVREVTDKPIVFDIHDSMVYRTDNPEKTLASERLAIELSNGLVFCSEACRDMTHDFYKQSKDKHYKVLYPFVNSRFYKTRENKWVGGVVYQGNVLTDKHPKHMQYANYYDLIKESFDVNIPIHFYTVGIDDYFKKYYEGAYIRGTLGYSDLLNALGEHDWGMCGNTIVYKDWQVAMPNKMFEYMAAGIPTVCINAKTAGEFAEKHGIGISVTSLDELKERWDERAKCQFNVLRKRQEFTMESQIYKIEDLYRSVQ